MNNQITINGREYSSVEEMPPDVRKEYERAMSLLADRDGNGVPDVFEGQLNSSASVTTTGAAKDFTSTVVTSSQYVVNGKNYDRWEDISAELREVVKNAGTSGQPLDMSRTISSTRDFRMSGNDDPTAQTSGITIRLTWSTIFALLLLFAAVVGWWLWQR